MSVFKTFQQPHWFKFKLAKLFGRKLNENIYEWRGQLWVMKDCYFSSEQLKREE